MVGSPKSNALLIIKQMNYLLLKNLGQAKAESGENKIGTSERHKS